MLKIVVKLQKASVLNLELYFYKDLRNVAKTENICTLKILINTDLNIYRLFSERLIITIAIAYKRSEVIKLLIKEYSATLLLYSIYIVI